MCSVREKYSYMEIILKARVRQGLIYFLATKPNLL